MVAPHPLPSHLRGRPFTTEQARAAGFPIKALEGRRFRSLWRGVHVEASVPDDFDLRVHALALVLPAGAAFSHWTAARLLDLPVREDALLHVSAPDPTRRGKPREGVRWHESVPATDIELVLGVPATSPCRTFTDMAEHLSATALVVLGDAVLRGLATRDELRAAIERAAGRRGVVAARTALPELRERVDSPMETRARLVLVAGGLPCPEVNVDVFDRYGGWLARCDLVYREARIVIEFEGDHHRTDRRQWMLDVRRHDALREAGWYVMRITADDVLRDPHGFVARVRRLLRERTSQPAA